MRWLAISLLTLCLGCHLYKPVDVRVLDIETRQPVPVATVSASYAAGYEFFPPAEGVFKVNHEGVARVWIASGWEGRVRIRLEAPEYVSDGYLTENGSSISPGHFGPFVPAAIRIDRSDIRSLPKRLVLETWRAPDPQFEVVVPDDFRGHIKVQFNPLDVINLSVGQRRISRRMEPDGTVQFPLTRPILTSLDPADASFRFESGAVIPKAVKLVRDHRDHGVPETAVAVRYGRGGVFIGTSAEANAAESPQGILRYMR